MKGAGTAEKRKKSMENTQFKVNTQCRMYTQYTSDCISSKSTLKMIHFQCFAAWGQEKHHSHPTDLHLINHSPWVVAQAKEVHSIIWSKLKVFWQSQSAFEKWVDTRIDSKLLLKWRYPPTSCLAQCWWGHCQASIPSTAWSRRRRMQKRDSPWAKRNFTTALAVQAHLQKTLRMRGWTWEYIETKPVWTSNRTNRHTNS